MGPLLILVAASLYLRFLGAAARRRSRAVTAGCGWLAGGLAGWLAASAAGAWTPYWAALIPAALGALLYRRWRGRYLSPVVDGVSVAVTAVMSHPPLPGTRAATVAVAFMIAGFALDIVAAALDKRIRHVVPALALLGALAFVPDAFPRHIVAYLKDQPQQLRCLAVTPVLRAERVVLPGGSVAWLDRPAGVPKAGALFFHGHHRLGAAQPAALAVRRALLENGFMVLSLDYTGFGESPAPRRDAEVSAWDPLPADLQACDALRDRLGSDEIFFVGHSMGTGDVARMLASDRAARGAAMLGAGLTPDKPVAGDFWYDRFNREYRYNPPIAMERFAQIANAYYDKEKTVRAMTERHAPLLFVEFKHENPNLAETRDALYALIPGKKSTALCDSAHYLYSGRVDGLLVGDPAPTGRLARILGEHFDLSAPAVAGVDAPASATEVSR